MSKVAQNKAAEAAIETAAETSTTTGNGTRQPRNAICKKELDVENRRVIFTFADNPATVVVLSPADYPENVQTHLTLAGIRQIVGDKVGKEVEASINTVQTMDELLRSGHVTEGRESVGAKPSMVVDAVLRTLEEDGKEITDELRNNVKDKVASTDGRKRALNNPKIAYNFEVIKSERAAAKLAAKKAELEAASQEALNLDDFAS